MCSIFEGDKFRSYFWLFSVTWISSRILFLKLNIWRISFVWNGGRAILWKNSDANLTRYIILAYICIMIDIKCSYLIFVLHSHELCLVAIKSNLELCNCIFILKTLYMKKLRLLCLKYLYICLLHHQWKLLCLLSCMSYIQNVLLELCKETLPGIILSWLFTNC